MAWYAELCRLKWYCINGIDMVLEYKKYLFDILYDSLTEEQKQQLKEKRKKEKEKSERELHDSIIKLAMMTGAVFGMYDSNKYDKYHGLYDDFGFPKR